MACEDCGSNNLVIRYGPPGGTKRMCKVCARDSSNKDLMDADPVYGVSSIEPPEPPALDRDEIVVKYSNKRHLGPITYDDHFKRARYLKAYRLRTKYDISLEEYDAMMESQGGRCLICKESYDDLVVDHCHTTGAVRGLLCSRCNSGLGFFKDNKDSLANAIDYLNMNPSSGLNRLHS